MWENITLGMSLREFKIIHRFYMDERKYQKLRKLTAPFEESISLEGICDASPEFPFDYLSFIVEQKYRLPLFEPYIMKNTRAAYSYSKNVIKSRWYEAEKYIKEDPFVAYFYAKDLVESRWQEAEKTIAASPWAFFYAHNVIKGRWPEAEMYMKKNYPNHYRDYCKAFL